VGVSSTPRTSTTGQTPAAPDGTSVSRGEPLEGFRPRAVAVAAGPRRGTKPMEETGVVPTGNGRASPRLAGGSTPRSWLSPQDARMRGGPRKRIRAHPRSGGGRNQQGGTGRGDTVRLLARASSGGMSVAGKRRSSLGRGTATFRGRGGRRGNAANPSRQQAAIRLRPRSWNRLRTRSGAARGVNRRGGVKPRGRNVS
jgi:hypothetical protein